MLSYSENMFPFDTLPTYLNDCTIELSHTGAPTQLNMWDINTCTAHDLYLRPLIYHRADIFIITFSITFPGSLESVETRWYPEIKQHCPNATIFLVATKIDLRRKYNLLNNVMEKWSPVTSDQGVAMAKKLGIRYFETSALTGKGVRSVFEAAIRM